MESARGFGDSVKQWCERFEQEARTLRDIGKGIRVLEQGGKSDVFYAQELWLRRNTDILERFPLLMGEDGEEEIRISGKLGDYLLDKSNFVKAVRNVCFPHSPYTALLADDAFIAENWRLEFRKNSDSPAWDLYPEAMAAAEKLVCLTGLIVEKLVCLTGLIVSDDAETDTASGVF